MTFWNFSHIRGRRQDNPDLQRVRSLSNFNLFDGETLV